MGTVINFPRVRGRHKSPAKTAGTAAAVIILPVVRIERDLEERDPAPPSGLKAKAARSVTRSMTKATAKRLANAIAEPAACRKPGRKRAAPALPSPACGRG